MICAHCSSEVVGGYCECEAIPADSETKYPMQVVKITETGLYVVGHRTARIQAGHEICYSGPNRPRVLRYTVGGLS